MSAEVTVADALVQLQGNTITSRNEGIKNLTTIFRHIQRNPGRSSLGSKAWHEIYKVLFNLVLKEKSEWLSPKAGSSQTAAEIRLSDAATALRLGVELGVKAISLKVVRSILDHIVEALPMSKGGLCVPIAEDYARASSALLSYEPHVEHLEVADRTAFIQFCVHVIASSEEDSHPDAEAGAERLSTKSSIRSKSHKSSRSQLAVSNSSSSRKAVKQACVELAVALQALTVAPDASLGGHATSILQSFIDLLKGPSRDSNDDRKRRIFQGINNVLSWSRTNDVSLTRRTTAQMIRLISHFWPNISSPKDTMLVTLLLLRPFMVDLMATEEAFSLRSELTGLYDVLREEYSKRSDRDHSRQLRLSDLRLALRGSSEAADGQVALPVCSLRSVGQAAEHSWALVSILATVSQCLSLDDADVKSESEDEDGEASRPRKRQRLVDGYDELLRSIRGSVAERICALQTIAFLAQQTQMTTKQVARAIRAVSPHCADENSPVSSWASLTLASLAMQYDSASSQLSAQWTAVWQVASRSITNLTTCRYACHLLYVLMHHELVQQSAPADLAKALTASMELSGPSLLADSVSNFLRFLLRMSQQSSPATAAVLAETTLTWTLRQSAISRFEDRGHAMYRPQYEASDVACLISACMNHDGMSELLLPLPIWHEVAQSWIACEEHHSLVSYLVLSPGTQPTVQLQTSQQISTMPMRSSVGRVSCENTMLNHMLPDVEKTIIACKQIDLSQLTKEQFILLCQSCCTVAVLAYNCVLRDTRRQEQLKQHIDKLLGSLTSFLSSLKCDDSQVLVLLSTSSQLFGGLQTSHQGEPHVPSPAERLLCKHLEKAITARRRTQSLEGRNEDGDMDIDMDDNFDSQDSRQGRQLNNDDQPSRDIAVRFSAQSMHACSQLYVSFIASASEDGHGSSRTKDLLVSLPETVLLSGRRVLAMAPRLGVALTPADFEALLGHCLDTLLGSYDYDSKEVAHLAVLDLMSSYMSLWTDRKSAELFELGADVYSWYVNTMAKSALSPAAQTKFATFLLQLCEVDTDYGRDSECAQSARTSLFRLLKVGSIPVLYHLADRILAIFGHFVLATHEHIFSDLQGSLPDEVDWMEGMAMRLLFLARLASSWHSLLRHCIYYIFETAGRVKSASKYASRCIAQLSDGLGFNSAQKLFRLFAPQLLHTWLETQTLNGLPYAAFQYTTLLDLLRDNQAEIVSQLLIREGDDGLHGISTLLKTSEKDLARSAFAKAVAYTISWDVSKNTSETNTAPCESRLRNLIGNKEEYKMTILRQFPVIMANFYLAMQQDDVHNTWLDKWPIYSKAGKALAETTGYSSSTKPLPATQQPSFKSKYLPDAIGRLCRRTTYNADQPWNASSFSLSARILLNSVDEALGPLHLANMLRKLRTLICMAGDVALTGYPLEMLIQSVRPFLDNDQCADDALGVLHYLLDHGRSYLLSDAIKFTNGAITLMVLQMRKHSTARQERTTQESQYRETVKKMDHFQEYLLKYLQPQTLSGSSQSAKAQHPLIDILRAVQLPGNARKDTAESHLLLLLLQQYKSSHPLMSPSSCTEALNLLTQNFGGANTIEDNCLARDEASQAHSDNLWHYLKLSQPSNEFKLWAAEVLGRAYAATGKRPKPIMQRAPRPIPRDRKPQDSLSESQQDICHSVYGLVVSPRRETAGLADWTLRRMLETFQDAEAAVRFEQMLPSTIVPATEEGTSGYLPHSAAELLSAKIGRQQLREALAVSHATNDEAWARKLAITICQFASAMPILPALPALLQETEGLAQELLPSIVHLVLADEVDREHFLSPELSASISSHLNIHEAPLRPRQQLLLRLLLCLRGKAYPGESTVADRTRWLEVDPLLAAQAAARCELPSAALLFAESAATAAPSNRRASSRMSVSQLQSIEVPSELLLSVFEQIEEPDSFYGVEQPASLDTVLQKLQYEGDGLGSLMFCTAQMDSKMRTAHEIAASDSVGMVRALSALNLDSLQYALLSGPMADAATSTDQLLRTAQKLQQWDLATPSNHGSASTCFAAYQELSRASSLVHARLQLSSLLSRHLDLGLSLAGRKPSASAWWNSLSSLAESLEITGRSSDDAVLAQRNVLQSRCEWLQSGSFDQAHELASSRPTLLSVLSQNVSLAKEMRVSPKTLKVVETEVILQYSRLARKHGLTQEALSSATQASLLAKESRDLGLCLTAASTYETASVLWMTGQAAASVKMLRSIVGSGTSDHDDIPVGESGVLAQLAHQLAVARLEKPEEILSSCLKPAIKHLKGRSKGSEAGRVFHEFAAFCDSQLQNPGNLEDFNRIIKLREKKESELEDLIAIARNSKKSAAERDAAKEEGRRAQKWLNIDNEEYQRLKKERDDFTQQSLQNYLLALQASEEHDISVLRFFAMWLENADSPPAYHIAGKHLDSVPSWKFVVLLNQLFSRLENEKTPFQQILKKLVQRICAEHPHHSLHHLYAATRKPTRKEETAALSRQEAAQSIRGALQSIPQKGELVKKMIQADNYYNDLSQQSIDTSSNKVAIKDFPAARSMTQHVMGLHVPPATINVQLRPDGDYSGVPTVQSWGPQVQIMSGLSHPKALTARATDGQEYKMLFKSHHTDDLRQDAIMEQVFEEVSKMLKNHKEARRRDLHVRTYKVIPLTTRSGIIEWVRNSIPIGEFLKPAHVQYYPTSMKSAKANEIVRGVEKHSVEERIKEYRKICEQMPPVMRHFFFERFDDPDEWFEKRTAYTRTTATISILGHVLGLGDRHCQNIVLDEKTGEAVHIDLGVAFEAGRILPVPELVPFRLTRDIIDGMGITKIEGVFRRCCEFTMDALREDKDSIMTLLNVLRYDPLYTWTVSPLRAKRMQEASEAMKNGDLDETGVGAAAGSVKRQEQSGEADRALSIVEKKLSKTLSTAATVNELIQQATDERNLATLFAGWSAYF